MSGQIYSRLTRGPHPRLVSLERVGTNKINLNLIDGMILSVSDAARESEVADVLHRFSWFQYVRHGIRPLANRAVLSGLISRKLSKQSAGSLTHSLTLYTWWWRWCSGAHFRFLLFVAGIIRWKTTL